MVKLDETGKAIFKFIAPDDLTTWSISTLALGDGAQVAQSRRGEKTLTTTTAPCWVLRQAGVKTLEYNYN